MLRPFLIRSWLPAVLAACSTGALEPPEYTQVTPSAHALNPEAPAGPASPALRGERIELPPQIISRHALARAPRLPTGAYDFAAALSSPWDRYGGGIGRPAVADVPDITVNQVRVVYPTAAPTDGTLPVLRIVEFQIMYRGLPVREGKLLGYFADEALHGLRGDFLSRTRLNEAFGKIDAGGAIGAERARRSFLDRLASAPGPSRTSAPPLVLVWDLGRRRPIYTGWDGESRFDVDALTGDVLAETRFGPVPGWEPFHWGVTRALSLQHPAPVELDWPLETILSSLQVFPNSLLDRKVNSWVQLAPGWVPKDCSFRLSYGAGDGTESLFPFPALHPGDTFAAVETRDAACFSQPYSAQPSSTDTDPASTRRALAYQSTYYYAMAASRLAAWDREAAAYTFLEPRQRLSLHIKALAPVDGWAPGCGPTYACYIAGGHTIRIVDSILFSRLVLHEFGHFVHHTYEPENFRQSSCLVKATQEGAADALRESMFGMLSAQTPSNEWFFNSAFPTLTRADAKSAIDSAAQCTTNPYGDGKAIGQIVMSLLNDRTCSFDGALGPSAPCVIERILGDARNGAVDVPRWGRESLTHAMMYTGVWSSSGNPPSPHLFVDSMGYWFKVLSEVYGLIQPSEWARIRALFLQHGIDLGAYQP